MENIGLGPLQWSHRMGHFQLEQQELCDQEKQRVRKWGKGKDTRGGCKKYELHHITHSPALSLATATCPQTEYNPGNIYKDQLPARSCATIFPGKISTSLTIAIFWCLVGKINPYTHLHKKQPVREIPIPYKISKKIP